MATATKKRRTLPSLDRVLALQIRTLRAKQGVSQQKLAEMLGETQSTVARIESGERGITVSEVFRIAVALNCAPIFLLSGGLTGEKIPVGTVRLNAQDAEHWIMGTDAVPGTDERAFFTENISRERSDQLVLAARNHPEMAEGLKRLREQGSHGS